MKTATDNIIDIMDGQKEIDKYWMKKGYMENLTICQEQIDKHQRKINEWQEIRQSFIDKISELNNNQK